MGRDPRYIPQDSLQHVMDATFQHRLLLCPSKTVNRRFLGILGRAQRKFEMPVCAVVVMSSHLHLLLRPRDGAHLASFMCFLKTNVAKEIGRRIQGWKGSFFDHRYHSTTVSEEELAQVGVLRYILSHGVKEHLVKRVKDWPGVHSAMATIHGDPMVGEWIDRTGEYVARGRKNGTHLDSTLFTSQEVVEISPLPCWEHLSESEWRRAVSDLVEGIDEAAAAERRRLGQKVLGIKKILTADPFSRPDEPPASPKPRFHAYDPKILRTMIESWRDVIRCFREASEIMRSKGATNVLFPEGTFPPARPFVPFRLDTGVGATRGHPF